MTVAGAVMVRIAPDALRQLSAGRWIALVSGTNGKSTTTAMTVAALGGTPATSSTGANLPSGIASALAGSSSPTAVLEVDELYLDRVAHDTEPDVIVALNLTRDQLDRMAEVGQVERRWRACLADAGAHVVANAADPHVVAAVGSTSATWIDPGWSWTADSVVCPTCTGLLDRTDAGWSCACGLRQPAADYRVSGSSLVLPDGAQLPLPLELPGIVNRGNAAFAVAVAALRGVDPLEAVGRIQGVRQVLGRYGTIRLGGRPALLLLAKNPAGWAAALPMLRDDDVVLVSINARGLDGFDTSWLWDVPFEAMASRVVGAHGDNRHDLAVRLEVAGAAPLVDADAGRLAGRLPQGGRLVVLANYTAFSDLRRGT